MMLFDDVNRAMLAQLDKLQSIDPTDTEQMELCIQQSRAASRLAETIIGNAHCAMECVKMQEELGLNVATPKMLGGGR